MGRGVGVCLLAASFVVIATYGCTIPDTGAQNTATDADCTRCNGTCTDTNNDNANCGACGVLCLTNEVCSHGACGTTCASDQKLCAGDAGKPFCASTLTDNANCGACGMSCGNGETCM